MTKKIMAVLFVMMLVLAGCGTAGEKQEADKQKEETTNGGQAADENLDYPQANAEVQENERLVEMVTSMGKIKIKLFPEQAPKAVENFIKHSEEGYYEGVTFHRVIDGFMIQGGDPEGTGAGGESIYGDPFEDEFSRELFNIRGALSMANAGANTNGSQFFIVQNKELDPSLPEQMKEAGYPEEVLKMYENGGTPHLDGKHTVFGQVIEGMDVVDKIASVPTGAGDKPEKDVVIEKINVLK
ncbi:MULTISPECIES: peptidylprolyl isomerase [Bacillaceae]|uniref:peptidylprolyl isomerase n=1 Tax=Bacillaceae TaxID=186817 RepID=UPI0011A32255|nr:MULTISPECIES: peptidylprolyl isomerase [Bacillaceae]MCM3125941.1 peptidylprolyl isomerase [Mesobacillus sp. MER 33]MCM3235072.1 peptidylprolyl isomerase [Mesobacillus sp. MER 48]